MAEEHRRFLATVESEEGTLRHVDNLLNQIHNKYSESYVREEVSVARTNLSNARRAFEALRGHLRSQRMGLVKVHDIYLEEEREIMRLIQEKLLYARDSVAKPMGKASAVIALSKMAVAAWGQLVNDLPALKPVAGVISGSWFAVGLKAVVKKVKPAWTVADFLVDPIKAAISKFIKDPLIEPLGRQLGTAVADAIKHLTPVVKSTFKWVKGTISSFVSSATALSGKVRTWVQGQAIPKIQSMSNNTVTWVKGQAIPKIQSMSKVAASWFKRGAGKMFTVSGKTAVTGKAVTSIGTAKTGSAIATVGKGVGIGAAIKKGAAIGAIGGPKGIVIGVTVGVVVGGIAAGVYAIRKRNKK